MERDAPRTTSRSHDKEAGARPTDEAGAVVARRKWLDESRGTKRRFAQVPIIVFALFIGAYVITAAVLLIVGR